MQISTLQSLVLLREKAFDAGNSGKYGKYPTEIEEFNKEVEEGFSDNGITWTSKDGKLVLTIEELTH